jgi:uncharacterized protein
VDQPSPPRRAFSAQRPAPGQAGASQLPTLGRTPVAGDEVALLWRHPTRHDVLHRQADSAALLVLEAAVERLPLAQTAEAVGRPLTWLEAQVARLAEAGLVLAPA